MLKVYRNTENNIYATFSESMIDLSDWIYLKFNSEANPDIEFSTVLKTNLSSYPRIDKFILTEVSNGQPVDPELGQINFKYDGYYEYWAYELDSSLAFDPVDPAIIKLVENGRCFVVGSTNLLENLPDLSVYE